MFVTVFTLLALSISGIALRGGVPEELLWNGVRPQELLVALLVPVAALVAVLSKSRLASVASLGVVGYGLAWLFAIFGAPDLAATQIVIESLPVHLLVLALAPLPRHTTASWRRTLPADALLATAVGAVFTVLLLHATAEPHLPPISQWYAEHSEPQAHGRNIVNVILVDFRALDTLGEITVLATAAVGVWALLRLKSVSPARKEREE